MESLDEMLAQALRNNPDIGVAEAKLQEAEAEVTRCRMEVIDKVTRHQAALAEARERLTTAERLFLNHAFSEEELRMAKLVLAKLEAETPYLLGKARSRVTPRRQPVNFDSVSDFSGELSTTARLAPQLPPLSDEGATRLAVALNQKISIDFEVGSLQEALNYLRERYNLPVFGVAVADEKKQTLKKVSATDIPLGALFQLITDLNPGLAFVIRDYGILVTEANNVPPGAPTVREFWLAHQTKK
jgi:hypothetical protein